ncbi:uncharacterized protein GGS25DRAFT_4861 [Hypoxylon fragiforme]|uniref:uncharacterized protein n=1 Tax=Hypoxylon fragiforme TaxID=63214 RepID=UPI0020C71E0B|nr:uncharacterized protein GGS25DRAFT_4861 [Hypoxylon fragiforme]KAI2613568.1 hypothetical protein GGS25DRAFT_4861 [Hypoxylon fragiforme]
MFLHRHGTFLLLFFFCFYCRLYVPRCVCVCVCVCVLIEFTLPLGTVSIPHIFAGLLTCGLV